MITEGGAVDGDDVVSLVPEDDGGDVLEVAAEEGVTAFGCPGEGFEDDAFARDDAGHAPGGFAAGLLLGQVGGMTGE